MTVLADRAQKRPAVECILYLFSEVFKGFSDCRTLISLIFSKGQEVERFCLCFQKIQGLDIIVLKECCLVGLLGGLKNNDRLYNNYNKFHTELSASLIKT